jgi:type IV pilus assembly protein PilV
MSVKRPPRKEGGFSLLEALIAFVIIMIGLLGVAGLQALGVRSSGQAHLRTLASLDAHSLAASMRANRDYWAKLTPPASILIQAPASGTTVTITPAIDSANCVSETCTPEQTAGYNLKRWGSQLATMQHEATAKITRIANSGTSASAYKVRVVWSEQHMQGQGVNAPSSATHHTVVVVQP